MIKLVCIIVLCGLLRISSAQVSDRQKTLEHFVFYPSSYSKVSEPQQTSSWIAELHKIYSKNGGKGIYKDIVEKLAELPNLSSCDDDAFLKFDLLEDLGLSDNVRAYLRNQRVIMSKQCDKKLWQEFDAIVSDLDDYVSDSVSRLAVQVASPYYTNEMFFRPLFYRETLIRGIDDLLTEVSKKYARRELLAKEELDSLYKTTVLGPCRGLTSEFDRISRFYVRNYLDKGTLKVCEDTPRRWTYISEVCRTVSADNEKIFDVLYKLVVKKHETPDEYVYKILERIGA